MSRPAERLVMFYNHRGTAEPAPIPRTGRTQPQITLHEEPILYIEKAPIDLIACVAKRCRPVVIATNSSRILPFSKRPLLAYRPAVAATSSSRVVMLIRPIATVAPDRPNPSVTVTVVDQEEEIIHLCSDKKFDIVSG